MTQPETYHRPDSLAEALDLLAAETTLRVAAGCTDLFPATERKILPGAILDITGIPTLRGIVAEGTDLLIGATTTWSDIVKADLPPACHGLRLAAREVGAKQIQNSGTIGGNLCNASPAADGVPPLLTLDAEVRIEGKLGKRQVPLSEFITGPRHTALAPGELVTGVLLPAKALSGRGHFLKLGARRYLVISIAMTAARIALDPAGKVRDVALAVGSCGPVATRLPAAEVALLGSPPDPSRITDEIVSAALSPIDDVRADATYRTRAAAELLRRTVASLCETELAA